MAEIKTGVEERKEKILAALAADAEDDEEPGS